MKWKVNGFCQWEWFSRDGLTRPENVCSTAKIDSGCYSTVAFSITKVLDKCIDTQPTSTTVWTWIGNNLYNSQKRTEKKSDVCYAWDGWNFNFSANNTVNWDSYTCMRRWAIPEIESYQLIKYPSISLNRNYSDKWITFSRTTKDTDSVQRSCKHSNWKTYWGVWKIYQWEYFTSWEQFHKDGFSSWTWNCTWNLSFWNQTKVETETVTIK